ncbi:MAG TPA: hypothetical protein VK630_20150 [Reyranella sp.]|nr:hypothetical protein [Reyranella sp.]
MRAQDDKTLLLAVHLVEYFLRRQQRFAHRRQAGPEIEKWGRLAKAAGVEKE